MKGVNWIHCAVAFAKSVFLILRVATFFVFLCEVNISMSTSSCWLFSTLKEKKTLGDALMAFRSSLPWCFRTQKKGVAKRSGGHRTVDKYIASTIMERVLPIPGGTGLERNQRQFPAPQDGERDHVWPWPVCWIFQTVQPGRAFWVFILSKKTMGICWVDARVKPWRRMPDFFSLLQLLGRFQFPIHHRVGMGYIYIYMYVYLSYCVFLASIPHPGFQWQMQV